MSSRCMPVAAMALASGSGELTVSSQRWNSSVPSDEVAQMVSQSAPSASVAVCARAGSVVLANSSVRAIHGMRREAFMQTSPLSGWPRL